MKTRPAAMSSTDNVRLWEPGERVADPEQNGLECITRVSGLRVAVAQKSRQYRDGDTLVLEMFAVVGEISLPVAIAGSLDQTARPAGAEPKFPRPG